MAVIFGGRSSEHAISCISAGSVLRALDPVRYDVVAIGITPDGRWVLESADPQRLQVVDGKLPQVDATGASVVLAPDPTRPRWQVQQSGGWQDLPAVDVVFPVLHGPWGEDGTVQGLLELAGVPYVGSGVFASAAAMDKGHAKTLLAAAGLPLVRHELVTGGAWQDDRTACLDRLAGLGLPVFVKPARAGSSVGISKVTDAADLVAAVGRAQRHDPRVVVEAAVSGAREIECGVLADRDGVPRASVCAEIRVRPGYEFYDFDAKYLDDSAELDVPAALPAATAQTVQHLAVAAFEALACEGLARVDFFVCPDGEVVLNEVNTMPGFTAISLFPRMWEATGLSYPQLVDRLLQDALRRGTGLR